jgi:flagellar biosynthetic protein FlhB
LHIAAAALTPRWTRLSPGASARRLVSVDGAAQAIIGLFLIAAAAVCAVPGVRILISAAALATPAPRGVAILWLIAREFWQLMAVAAIVVAIVDIALQRLRLRAALRMTPREVRDERAQHEGKPETKGRRRAITIRRTKGLRLRAIARATAVITNPAHVAVALRYAPPEIDVPVVVSRGAELAASSVRAAARFYGVPLVESPELARTLYQRVDVDDPIPEECYAAVAAIFAWLIRYHGRLRSGEES